MLESRGLKRAHSLKKQNVGTPPFRNLYQKSPLKKVRQNSLFFFEPLKSGNSCFKKTSSFFVPTFYPTKAIKKRTATSDPNVHSIGTPKVRVPTKNELQKNIRKKKPLKVCIKEGSRWEILKYITDN
ncbi:hypothetical protein DLM75_06905 [Leptospira stimsonii]|uniref:Uncharacterized protein n=1 Tax=Leptospira stimsonii TaxID=2202203 RepID=A0A396ZGK8_9LEPT|nr:hypothetical protein DLM75_06905 [Leptospira stimsonii]